jgi:hypothetical protein
MDAVVDKRWRARRLDRNPDVIAQQADLTCVTGSRVSFGHPA